ncbi:TetR/AcrR family transcriptional regulator [Desulfotruncus alcoholivorax]|uniref:TetR/AcrR family transcriptional regulator n=1 Tax=Desulfotruncus alcoholivorax TaxID=265477 RepID=UPI0003F6FAD8|nr:TetR/AcrR family transcriptional regulator [Desulfotruncus alcoholivorax]
MLKEGRQTVKTGVFGETTERPDNTRERLLLVAEELFAKKGYSGTSVREIGATLGIANSSILYYFPSKEKLYAAVLKRIAESMKMVIDNLPTDSGDDSKQVQVMVERLMEWAQLNTNYLQIIMRELMENSDRLAKARHMHLAGVVEAMRLPLDRMKSEGKLRHLDPALFLIHLLGSVTYFFISLPTVRQITGNKDAGDLYRKYKVTVINVIQSCINGGQL